MWFDAQKEGFDKDLREARDFEVQDRRRGTILTAYRCGNCGYVELYSPAGYSPSSD